VPAVLSLRAWLVKGRLSQRLAGLTRLVSRRLTLLALLALLAIGRHGLLTRRTAVRRTRLSVRRRTRLTVGILRIGVRLVTLRTVATRVVGLLTVRR
jgi:hypothetical protein